MLGLAQFAFVCVCLTVRSTNLVDGLSEVERVERETSFENKFFDKSISIQFRIHNAQFGPRSDGPWMFDNDTKPFEMKEDGTGAHAPRQLSLHTTRNIGDGSCNSGGSGSVSWISHLQTKGLSGLAGAESNFNLDFTKLPNGTSILGRIFFFRHINVDESSTDWKVPGDAGDQRTYSRGTDASIAWSNGSVAIAMENLMWKQVVRYPNPPNGPRLREDSHFEHSTYAEGDISMSRSDPALVRLLDPDGLNSFFAQIEYDPSLSDGDCYSARNLTISFYAVLKSFQLIEPSTKWEKVLGVVVGILHSALFGIVIIFFAICQTIMYRRPVCAECPGEEVETFGGTRRVLNSILAIASLGEVFLPDSDSTRSTYNQLSWLLFRDSAAHFGSIIGTSGSNLETRARLSVAPAPPISDSELNRAAFICPLLIAVPFIAFLMSHFAPRRYRSIPFHWFLFLGDWGMFVGYLSGFQFLVHRVKHYQSNPSIRVLQVYALIFLSTFFLGFNIGLMIQAYKLKGRHAIVYRAREESEQRNQDGQPHIVGRVHGFFSATPIGDYFHQTFFPFYRLYREQTIYFAVVDLLFLAANGIALGAIRTTSLISASVAVVLGILKFLLTLIVLPRRYALADYIIVVICFLEATIHALGLAAVFAVTLRWYHTIHIILLAVLIPFLLALVWYSDWYFAFLPLEYRKIVYFGTSQPGETVTAKETKNTLNTSMSSFHTAANYTLEHGT